MNDYTKQETECASLLRAEAHFMALRYDDDPAARIALLAAALEAEIVSQGGDPGAYKFFSGNNQAIKDALHLLINGNQSWAAIDVLDNALKESE